MEFINTIADVDTFKSDIMEVITTEEVKLEDVEKVIENIKHLVTASNYKSLNFDLQETVWEAIDMTEQMNACSYDNSSAMLSEQNRETSQKLMNI